MPIKFIEIYILLPEMGTDLFPFLSPIICLALRKVIDDKIMEGAWYVFNQRTPKNFTQGRSTVTFRMIRRTLTHSPPNFSISNSLKIPNPPPLPQSKLFALVTYNLLAQTRSFFIRPDVIEKTRKLQRNLHDVQQEK